MRNHTRTIFVACTTAVALSVWWGVALAGAADRLPQPRSLRGGNLGQALFAADVDGDGAEEYVAAAPGTRDGGAVLIFRSAARPDIATPWRVLTGEETFGWSAATLDDTN